MRQTLRQHAAPIWPTQRAVIAYLLSLSLLPLIAWGQNNAPSRREQAKAQFERAERDRAALEARPESSRTLKEYTTVVTEYQRVYLITAHATEAPASIHQVGELFRTMGDLFDVKYYQRAVDAYQYLLHEYPTSKYREDSLLAIGHIEQDDLNDSALAQKNYEQFLKLHPHSAHAAEVRALLSKMAAENVPSKSSPPAPWKSFKDVSDQEAVKAIAAEKTQPTTDTRPGAADSGSAGGDSVPVVSRIRTWKADTYTRIVIDVGAKVKYQAARISGPDRIYFDIEGAKLSAALLGKPIDLDSEGVLKNIRVAQNHTGTVRVVLVVNQASDYSVFLLPDPYRLVVDVYGNSAAAEAAARSTTPAPGPTTTDEPPMKSEKAATEDAAKTSSKIASRAPAKSADTPPKTKPDIQEQTPTASSALGAASGSTEANTKKRVGNSAKTSEIASTNVAKAPATEDGAGSVAPEATPSASASLDDVPPAVRPATVKKSARPLKSAHDQAEEMGPPSTPELTRDGQHSLTRALGLKIGRIVIDPGHGGHDTGTIGPTGLMEKDLCLDVSLRLGKLIQQRLPSAEVVFTRDDDSFVPLERRTEIANEAKADLFLSVHANSSQDRQTRGIETYYLNFTGSSDAMEVASRENALSDNSVHDLQDLVKKIARNEKIEESRDLATMIQDSLSKRMDNLNRGERNRGVRKAPFVVLIGADMPSVLAEISFISNPSDEQWLKKPENRQRVAEGLYHGIESYLHSTNSLTYNQVRAPSDGRAGPVARTGNSQ
jgi:N-acetylmuramoyl-L-alanine amidase